MSNLTGKTLAGATNTREGVEHDYYATPYENTEALMKVEKFEGDFIEPCVGGGYIAEVLKKILS